MESPSEPVEEYARALELMQFEIQRLWIVFGTFLLAETVLLGGLAGAFDNAPSELVIAGAAFGFLLVIPWWTGFEYCRSFYLLRIDQAKRYEAQDGFLTQGDRLAKGKAVGTRRIGGFVRFVRLQRGAWFLMTLFAAAFLGIAWLKASKGRTATETPNQSMKLEQPCRLALFHENATSAGHAPPRSPQLISVSLAV